MKYKFGFQLLLGFLFSYSYAQTEPLFPEPYTVIKIGPSKTDSTIKVANTPHFVAYDTSIKQGKLLLFMPGTNGIALKGPKNLFLTAVKQGYRVINLSYINTPAVARICRGETLQENSDCAEEFRMKRVFGTGDFSLINDEPQDAIVNRFTKLIIYLSKNDKKGNWNQYLENNAIKWSMVAVSGQSQGGGMAAFIAKFKKVPRVISFSGGWDYSSSESKKIAAWYSKKGITPKDRYYGTYHVTEPNAKVIDATYKALEISDDNIYKFDLEVPKGKKGHSNGVRNIGYNKQWIELLGRGN